MTPLAWIRLAIAVLLVAYIVYAFRPSTWRETNAAIDRANARAEAKIRADEQQRRDQALDVIAEPDPKQVDQLHDLICAASGLGSDDALPMARYPVRRNVRVVRTDA